MNWLDTTTAARELGIHPSTLKRKRDISGGFLETGKHYRFKTDSANSPVLWDVETIRQLMHERGMQARNERAAQQILNELQQEATTNG